MNKLRNWLIFAYLIIILYFEKEQHDVDGERQRESNQLERVEVACKYSLWDTKRINSRHNLAIYLLDTSCTQKTRNLVNKNISWRKSSTVTIQLDLQLQ